MMESETQVENDNDMVWNSSTNSKQNDMVSNSIEYSKFQFLDKFNFMQSNFTKNPQLFTDNSFIMWENNSNICWLDASMALLVHNQTMRRVIKLHPDCLVSKIIRCYDNAIDILNDFSSEIPTEERLHAAREILQKVQEISLQYLQPLIKYRKGEPDSAFCSLLNLIKEDKLIQGFFDITYTWCRICDNCEMQRVLTSTKPIITIANVIKFEPENHVSPCLCPVCKKKDQTMKLVYKKLPACLIFHFEKGAGNGNIPPLNFLVSSRQYQLTGVMILEKGQESNVNHFVTYIRDPLVEKWLECNDLNTDIVSFSENRPNFDLADVYIYVYEAFGDLETIQIEEDPTCNSSNHNIPCIDISEEEAEIDDASIQKTLENKDETEQSENNEETEQSENIENISAFLSASFNENSNMQPLLLSTGAGARDQKNMSPSTILPKISSNTTKTSNSKTSTSDITTVSDSTLSKSNLKNEKTFKFSSASSSPSKEDDPSEKNNVLQNKEHKNFETKKSEIIPLTPLSNEKSKFINIDKFINLKLNELELKYEKENKNKSPPISLSSSSNYASDSRKADNNETPGRKNKKKLLKDSKDDVCEQLIKVSSAAGSYLKNKVQGNIVTKTPSSFSNLIKTQQSYSQKDKIELTDDITDHQDIESKYKRISKEKILCNQEKIVTNYKLPDKNLELLSINAESKDLCNNNVKFSKTCEVPGASGSNKIESLLSKGQILAQRKVSLKYEESKVNVVNKDDFKPENNFPISINLGFKETILDKHKDTVKMQDHKKNSDKEFSQNEIVKGTLWNQNKDILSKKRGGNSNASSLQFGKRKINTEELSANVINYLRKRKKILEDKQKDTYADNNSRQLVKKRQCSTPDTLKDYNKKEILAKNDSLNSETNDYKLLLKMQQTSFKNHKNAMKQFPVHSLSVNASASNNGIPDMSLPSCSYKALQCSERVPKSRKHKISAQDLVNHANAKNSLTNKTMEQKNINAVSFQKSPKELDKVQCSLVDATILSNNENAPDIYSDRSSNYSQEDDCDIPVSKNKKRAFQVRFPSLNKKLKHKKQTVYKSDESDEKSTSVLKGKQNVFNEGVFSSESKILNRKQKSENLLTPTQTSSSPENSANEIEQFSNMGEAGETLHCDVKCLCMMDTDTDTVVDGTVDYFIAKMFGLFKVT